MHEDPDRLEALRALTHRLGLTINDFGLLDRALTHSSMSAETSGARRDYESLEFLGDAVLGLAVAHRLLEDIPDRTPGEYSRMRAGLVNRRCVARVGCALNIAPYIRLGKGEELSGGRHRTALLADCMEALIGAVYLDQGWAAAHEFVVRAFGDEIRRESTSTWTWDYKSRLQNYCQAERLGLPRFEMIRSEGPDHQKEFEIEVHVGGAPAGRGTGRSKKEAEQRAAKAALETKGVHVCEA